jgi:AraC-like DNA-binding protein
MQPSFDTWTSLFLLSSGFGFFLTIALAMDRENLRLNFPILFIVFGFSLILIQYVFFWAGYRAAYPWVFFFDSFWYVAFGPLLYLYFFQWKTKLTWKQWAHLAPPIFMLLMQFYGSIVSEGYTDTSALPNDPFLRLALNFRAPWIPFFYLSIYGILLLEFIPLKSEVNSPSKALQHRWTLIVYLFFWVFILAYGSYYALVNFSFFNVSWDYAISISMTLGIYGIGFLALKQPSIFNGTLLRNIFLTHEEGKGSISESTKEEWYQQVNEVIKEKSLFLKNDLRLIHLSEEVAIPLHELSRLINDKYGKNFNHFINHFRVEHAAELLRNDKSLTVLEICYMVGFNSKSTFYKAFKTKYDKTPQGYRDS